VSAFRLYEWDGSAFRPNWPRQCEGVCDERSDACASCLYLAGENRREYLTALGIKSDLKSSLTVGLQYIENGCKASDISSNLPKQGRHSTSVNEQARFKHAQQASESLRTQQRLETANILNDFKDTAHDTVQELKHASGQAHKAAQQAEQELAACKTTLLQESEQQEYLHFKNATLQQQNSRLIAENARLEEEQVVMLQKLHEAKSACDVLEASMALMTSSKHLTSAEEAWMDAWTHREKSTIKMDDLMSDLSILAGLEMSEQTYNTFKPFLRLPHYDHAIRLRKEHAMYMHYTLNYNDHAIELCVLLHAGKVTITSMDGTRMRRDIGLIGKTGLGGRQFPPDVRNWPTSPDGIPGNLVDLAEYIALCRGDPTLLSHDLCTIGIQSVTSNPTNFIPICLFPEPVFGFGVKHAILLMMQTAVHVWKAGIQSFGECTDSCSSDHGAGLHLQTPRAFLLELFPYWVGVNVTGFKYWAPIIAVGDMTRGKHHHLPEPKLRHCR
jgi:hypothetical protein